MQSESAAKKSGAKSLALFIAQLIGIVVFIIFAQNSDGRGHISAAAILAVLIALGMLILAPIGIALGLAGAPKTNRKAMVGLVGNSVLGLLLLVGLIFGR